MRKRQSPQAETIKLLWGSLGDTDKVETLISMLRSLLPASAEASRKRGRPIGSKSTAEKPTVAVVA